MADKLSPLQQELLNRADSILSAVGSAVSRAADFAGEQIPDIAYQFLAYNRIYYTSIFVVCIVWVILQQILTIKFAKKQGEECNDSGLTAFIWCVCTAVAGLPVIIAIFSTFKPLLMVWFAPKIFLIEQIVHLAKSV